jgi:hypothetical protein
MWLVRIIEGVAHPASRMDDFVTVLAGTREVRRPLQARAWRTKKGAAAISQSPEGAEASARRVLEQPDNSQRLSNTLSEMMKAMKGSV